MIRLALKKRQPIKPYRHEKGAPFGAQSPWPIIETTGEGKKSSAFLCYLSALKFSLAALFLAFSVEIDPPMGMNAWVLEICTL